MIGEFESASIESSTKSPIVRKLCESTASAIVAKFTDNPTNQFHPLAFIPHPFQTSFLLSL